MYSLDLENDPLGVILLIDFYAIRSSEYQYLIDFYDEFVATKHLNLLPNMLMSAALAHFYLYCETKNQANLDKANQLLKDCLVRFPSILMELLDKCSVAPDKKVLSSWIFSKEANLKYFEQLKHEPFKDFYFVFLLNYIGRLKGWSIWSICMWPECITSGR